MKKKSIYVEAFGFVVPLSIISGPHPTTTKKIILEPHKNDTLEKAIEGLPSFYSDMFPSFCCVMAP